MKRRFEYEKAILYSNAPEAIYVQLYHTSSLQDCYTMSLCSLSFCLLLLHNLVCMLSVLIFFHFKT